jgi:hypothetical protein
VSAWPEPPSAIPAGPSEGVHDGTEAFALGTTERAIYTGAAARIAARGVGVEGGFCQDFRLVQSEQFCSDTAEGGEYGEWPLVSPDRGRYG